MESSAISLTRLKTIQHQLLLKNSTSHTKKQDLEELIVEEGPNLLKATLNRPKQLNSLTTKMIDRLSSIMKKANQSQKPLLLLGNEKAFCAGGDLKRAHKEISETDGFLSYLRITFSFLFRFAALNSTSIAVCDGYAFGMGCGLLTLSKVRIVTEAAVLCMPQARNGTLSSEGFSYACSKLPKHIGKFLVLTGKSLKGAEIYDAGLADHFVLRKNLPALVQEIEIYLQSGAHIDGLKEVIGKYEEKHHPKRLKDEDEIKKYFSEKYLKDIVRLLDRESHRDARAEHWLTRIKEACPWMLLHNNFLMEHSAGKTLEESSSLEYHFLGRIRPEDAISGFARLFSQNLEVPTAWSMPFQEIRTFNEDDLVKGKTPIYDFETLSQEPKSKV